MLLKMHENKAHHYMLIFIIECGTVNPEIFTRIYFSLIFANLLPSKNKVLAVNKELQYRDQTWFSMH